MIFFCCKFLFCFIAMNCGWRVLLPIFIPLLLACNLTVLAETTFLYVYFMRFYRAAFCVATLLLVLLLYRYSPIYISQIRPNTTWTITYVSMDSFHSLAAVGLVTQIATADHLYTYLLNVMQRDGHNSNKKWLQMEKSAWHNQWWRPTKNGALTPNMLQSENCCI